MNRNRAAGGLLAVLPAAFLISCTSAPGRPAPSSESSAGGRSAGSVNRIVVGGTGATDPAAAVLAARRACAPSAVRPRTLADVAAGYSADSAAAARAASLDGRWQHLAAATSALANSWQVLQHYPTKRGHPLALNVKAMTTFQTAEYRRRYAVATEVYTTILVECRKAGD